MNPKKSHKDIKLELNHFQKQWKQFMDIAGIEDPNFQHLVDFKLTLKEHEDELIKNAFRDLKVTGRVLETTASKFGLTDDDVIELTNLWRKRRK